MIRPECSIPTMIAVAPLLRHTLASGHSVSGHAQKSVLLVLWHSAGWPTTLESVALRASASRTTAWRAMEALIEQNIVTRGEREGRLYAWPINEVALKSLAAKHIVAGRKAAP